MVLSACQGTITPPVDSASHLETLVSEGQPLAQVLGNMTPRLESQTMIYPANGIEKQANGQWTFTSKSGGIPGDTDAPFLALVITPDTTNEDYYVIFFKDDRVMSHEWFTFYYANFIHQALGVLPTAVD
jgi:hypothetical protein